MEKQTKMTIQHLMKRTLTAGVIAISSLITISSLSIISSDSAFAAQEKTDVLPIQINSENQQLDMPNYVTTFTGTVVVTRGDMRIEADKVVITQPNGEKGQEVMEAFGNPVRFSTVLDNGKPVKGHAQKLRYEMAKELVILTNKAYLEQEDSNIKGERITYLVKEQQMSASGDKDNRVHTIFIPGQFTDNKK